MPVEVEYLADTSFWSVLAAPMGIYVTPRVLSTTAKFDKFIDQLDAWEVDLLQHTTLGVDPYAACWTLMHGFRAVSDGSVRHQTQGAFGWSLCSDLGERVATGMGPARGPCPTSYCAEAVGMLSVLRLLIRLSEYTAMHDPWSGIIGTDSKSVLDTLGGVQADGQRQHVHEPIRIDW